ncbi:exopolysaccharide biosynthesis protein [Rhizobium sp. CIAT894]|uniref:exopolysaccharide biosynthesis protein n=1 Tax=Rhizobium sp. CIAT894 TaxID=2020312 RepID=UPI0019D09D5A|nr:exopolysaccharide biosynthesis protein [Rhizobium sp. CIAT894]
MRQMAADRSRERISIGDLFQTMGDRAISALMLIFALPNAFPTPPGTSAVLGAPLVFLAVQLTFGLKPWLPRAIADRSMRREDFETIVGRIHRWLAWAERMLKPRLAIFAEPPAEYLAGLACLALSIVLVLPVPLGNILPAITISVFAFGIMGRDGLFALGGFVMTAVSLVIAGGVIYGLVKAGVYLVMQWLA